MVPPELVPARATRPTVRPPNVRPTGRNAEASAITPAAVPPATSASITPAAMPLPRHYPSGRLRQSAQFTLTPFTSFSAGHLLVRGLRSNWLTFAIRSPIRVSSPAPVLIGLAFPSFESRPAQAAICNATAMNDLDVFISLRCISGASLRREFPLRFLL